MPAVHLSLHARHSMGGQRLGETYEFDGDLLVVQQVGAFEYDTKGALSNLLPDAIVHTDDIAAA